MRRLGKGRRNAPHRLGGGEPGKGSGGPLRHSIHAADVQDRDGGVLLMGALFGLYPFLLKLYADRAYQGAKFQTGLQAVCGQVNMGIVRRCDRHKFVVLRKR